MADLTNPKDALLTEHFRYTPLSLIDDIINTVNAIIYRAIQAIENGLLSTPPQVLGFGVDPSSTDLSIRDTDEDGNEEYPEAHEEIENGVHQLETLLEATVDKTFDKFEIYTLRNILTVPDDLAPWMRLGHYENVNLAPSVTSPTPESILSLRRTLQETQKLNLALQSTHARNAALITQLHSLISPSASAAVTTIPTKKESSSSPSSFPSHPPPPQAPTSLAFLNSTPTFTANHALTSIAQFTTSQLPSLRALLASLRPKLASLRAASAFPSRNARAEERREYIESVTGRVVRDYVGEEGESGIVGRRVVGEEVEALEGIVDGFLREKEGRDEGDGDENGDVRMGH
ncbi:MAG: hypothetical protein Q9187_008950 [Circinaria calcarea]